ncbi:aminotransferase class V-fold PLP-dependent enzyme [Phototrophicus methaneseepsis]|uniref:Aminotransferase class V-fold PLP-dependent enzyme n=1 Tax=Phototrophicus methaneseepsis TaxID=2710758 RepID=A0A7S8IF37_9CHLR|nr:aminotransferase class V-fold PLP-dependent enzyme [Phototrophicus methaneseepsis]QPC83206.1 aminotransferase class V-fold PLP-dependent enzyme [Phototrophicus methaneseepsis]
MQEHWLVDPTVTFLNHGSFGACPEPVFKAYQDWQRALELQPVEFMGRRYDGLMDEARSQLAAYVGVPTKDLIFMPNATVALNLVARSLDLQPGDVIVLSNHEYGAVEKTWQYVANKTGARLLIKDLPLPLTDPQQIVDALFSDLPAQTKAICVSHISSPTALIFPIAEICQRAQALGLLSIIDGAHAPGQIPLDITALGADFYTGNCHKWLCAPKGSAFLYVKEAHQPMMDPLVISWGWGWPDSDFISMNQWQGTRDVAAYLTVPTAIAYQKEHDWDAVRERCHALAIETLHRIADLTELAPVASDSFYGQMVAAPLPDVDPTTLKTRLYDDYRIEVPTTQLGMTKDVGPYYIRVSFQAYNTRADADKLLQALAALL